MASCVWNISTTNYQNLLTGFQVTIENVGDVFVGTQCRLEQNFGKRLNVKDHWSW